MKEEHSFFYFLHRNNRHSYIERHHESKEDSEAPRDLPSRGDLQSACDCWFLQPRQKRIWPTISVRPQLLRLLPRSSVNVRCIEIGRLYIDLFPSSHHTSINDCRHRSSVRKTSWYSIIVDKGKYNHLLLSFFPMAMHSGCSNPVLQQGRGADRPSRRIDKHWSIGVYSFHSLAIWSGIGAAMSS